MNKYNAKDYLPLVQALIDGKTVQARRRPSDSWQDASNPDFSWSIECYRIKPEPRVVYVVYTIVGNRYATYGDAALANSKAASIAGTCRKFVEEL